MSIALGFMAPTGERNWRQLSLAVVSGLACAAAIARTLPLLGAITTFPVPLCVEMVSSNSSLNKVEVIASHALPNVAGKRITVVRVSYGPGGFTPPHRHGGSVTAYITKGQILSQLKGGPLEKFEVGQSFFEPPDAIHLVSANASNTEPAELIAVFVADEGAELTTLLDR